MSRILAGDRRVWAVAGGTLGVLLVGVLIALALPRDDYYTGSNSIAVQSLVGDVREGQELCVPQLDVPGGTGRVRFAAYWTPGQKRGFSGRLESGSRVFRGRTAPTTRSERVEMTFPRIERGGRFRLCVRPRGGLVAFGGKKELIGAHPRAALPTLDGKLVRSEIAVWFKAPKSDTKSSLELMPDALRRAPLFRPSFIGGWTYVLFLFLLMPALCVAAIRMLALRVAGVRRGLRTALAVGGVAATSALTWALITPPFDAPDEPEHYAYAQSLAETGRAPQKGLADRPPYSSTLATALDAVRIYARVQEHDERPPWTAADERRAERLLANPGLRVRDGGGYLVSTSTHAPPYYVLVAGPYLAVGGHHPFEALFAMRLISVLLAGLTAAFTFMAIRELFPRQEWVATAAGLLVAFQPMFGFISGSVNNDNGVNATAALALFLLVRALRRGLTVRLALGIGATLVLLPLMKGTGYGLLPAALVAVIGLIVRQHRRRDLPAWAALGGSLVALQAAWGVIASGFDRSAYTTPGGTAPIASNGLLGGVLKAPLNYLEYFWQVFLPKLPFMQDRFVQRWPAFDIYVERGWAAFGWYAQKFPQWVNVTIAAVMLATGALCVVAVWRERRAARSRVLELAVLLAALAGVMGGVHAAYQADYIRPVVAEQGRYAFTAIVPLAGIAVGAGFAFGRRRAPLVAGALVALVAGFAVASYMLAFTRFFM